jgi:GNAT superfamily N-acetyltransferase
MPNPHSTNRQMTSIEPRLGKEVDANVLAQLLHDFNTEFDTPSPGVGVLEARLRTLLANPSTFSILTDSSPVGFALVTLRPSVWFDGYVAIVDELYVEPISRGQGLGTKLIAYVEQECLNRKVDYIEINVDEGDTDARRFYERLGYSGVDSDTGETALYYSRSIP